MRHIFIILLIYTITMSSKIFAQDNEEIVIKSLLYFNEKLSLHLELMGKPILISYNNNEDIFNMFVNQKELQPLEKLQFKYTLKKVESSKYEFALNVVSVYNGTFRVNEDDSKKLIRSVSYVESLK